jgi:hypothetical protein
MLTINSAFSILAGLLRDIVNGPEPAKQPREQKPKPKGKPDIISRRDERGTPYKGDFPNPASDKTKGCF